MRHDRLVDGWAMDNLAQHGVPEEHCAVLERWFGALPQDVDSPGQVIRWVLRFLPWPRLHPVLARWYARMLDSYGVEREVVFRDVADLLLVDAPDKDEARRQLQHLSEVSRMYARLYGWTELSLQGIVAAVVRGQDVGLKTRAWATSYLMIEAVLAEEDETLSDLAMATFACMLFEQEGLTFDARMDHLIRELVAALVTEVSGWAGGHLAWRNPAALMADN